ncbi:MAG: hypothetical protein PHP44_00535 [Kiritimatiellae bacterium]|nr:hypothetical protein [Kiritimatiellia bacterium]
MRLIFRMLPGGWAGLCLISGFYFFYTIPIPPLPVVSSVKVETTNRQNDQSESNEAWITGIFLPSGARVVPPESFTAVNGRWLWTNEAVCSPCQQEAILEWNGYAPKEAALQIIKSPWSGIVNVTLDGRTETMDLYAERNCMVDIPLTSGETPFTLLSVVYLIAHAVMLGGALFYFTAWLILRPSVLMEKRETSAWWVIAFSAPALCCWTWLLVQFWPGLMTNDSFDQWGQMLSGKYVDHHPVVHTLSNWLCTRIWLSPASVAVAQIVGLSLAAGIFLYRQVCWGLPRTAAVIIGILFALFPVNGFMAITLWKDVAYTICMLLFAVCMFEIAASRGAWLRRRSAWFFLGLVAALCSLFRHNGLPVVTGTYILLLILAFRYWKSITASLILCMLLVAAVKGPLYSALHVDSNVAIKHAKLTNICLPFVMAHVMQGAELTPEQKEVLRDIYPGEWRIPYSERTLRQIYFAPEFSRDKLYGTRSQDINRLAFELFKEDPWIDVEHFLYGTEYIWSIQQQKNNRYEMVSFWLSNGQVNYSTLNHDSVCRFPVEPLRIKKEMPIVRRLLEFTARNSWFACRTAIYLYLILFLSLCAALRSRSVLWLFLAVPVVLHTGLLLLAISFASNFRYQYPVMVIGLLVVPFLAFLVPKAEVPPCVQKQDL